jgi:hypothetical protein
MINALSRETGRPVDAAILDLQNLFETLKRQLPLVSSVPERESAPPGSRGPSVHAPGDSRGRIAFAATKLAVR